MVYEPFAMMFNLPQNEMYVRNCLIVNLLGMRRHRSWRVQAEWRQQRRRHQCLAGRRLPHP